MSRMYDRLLARGSGPLTGYDLMRAVSTVRGGDFHTEMRQMAIDDLTKQGGVPIIDKHIRGKTAQTIGRMKDHASKDRAEPGWSVLAKCHVLVADEVGWYFADQVGSMSGMLVAPVVPPFRQTFIDFRGVPNPLGLAEWGVHLSALDRQNPDDAGVFRHRGDQLMIGNNAVPDDARWFIAGSVYVSWDGRNVIGPIGTAQFFLRDDGSLYKVAVPKGQLVDMPTDEGIVQVDGSETGDVVAMSWMTGSDVAFERQLEPGFRREVNRALQELLYAGLLSVSFTHVKNVDVVEVVPEPKLSKAFAKRNGQPLNRHYVLDIGPMKRYLEVDGHASRDGLANAMHVCRGHFKTYTSEKPLFGRETGTFWWPSMVRGFPTRGAVSKDYRVTADEQLEVGRSWSDDDEDVSPASHDGVGNPDLAGRGWRAHAATLNALAQHVTDAGHKPVRARPDGPQFDCAWKISDRWTVAEVKSLTESNETEQMRRGIGQCVDYRQALRELTGREVRAVLVVEREPSSRWLEVCADADIKVAWPDVFNQIIG